MAAVSPVLPLIGGGKTRFQPVFVGDVAAAVAQAALDPGAAGKLYELGGPGVYTFKQLLELTLRETGRKAFLAPIPFPVASLIGLAGDLVAMLPIPIAPPLTTDQVTLLKADNVVAPRAAGLKQLGVEPTLLETVLPSYLFRYRKGGQYAAAPAARV
jgi:NADH dehydrogenase